MNPAPSQIVIENSIFWLKNHPKNQKLKHKKLNMPPIQFCHEKHKELQKNQKLNFL